MLWLAAIVFAGYRASRHFTIPRSRLRCAPAQSKRPACSDEGAGRFNMFASPTKVPRKVRTLRQLVVTNLGRSTDWVTAIRRLGTEFNPPFDYEQELASC